MIREIMTAGGVERWTAKLMGRMWSKLVAWDAVRGKPSRINDAVSDEGGEVVVVVVEEEEEEGVAVG